MVWDWSDITEWIQRGTGMERKGSRRRNGVNEDVLELPPKGYRRGSGVDGMDSQIDSESEWR
jgi:hypothetical protein